MWASFPRGKPRGYFALSPTHPQNSPRESRTDAAALAGGGQFYDGMSTSNETMDRVADLETEATTDEFGTNVSEAFEQQADFSIERVSTGSSLPCNVGYTEQKIRIGAGTALLAAAVFAPVSRGWKIAFAAVGVAEIVTGAMRYCPVSQALGVNTCRPGEERR